MIQRVLLLYHHTVLFLEVHEFMFNVISTAPLLRCTGT